MSFLFPFFFIGVWIFATYIIANMAWNDLVEHYRAPDHVEGKRIGINSLSINSVNYKNSIVLTYNEVGLYMKPILLFRLFHEPLLIPWTEMRVVRTKKILFTAYTEVSVGTPTSTILLLKEKTFNQFQQYINHQL